MTTVGNFDIFYNRNTLFTTISGFDKLKTTGYFHINGNTSVTSIPSFNSLETINGSNNTGAFNFLNQNITNISGFNSLKTVQGGPQWAGQTDLFQIANNSNLIEIAGFNNLIEIDGDVLINSNNSLLNMCQTTYNKFILAVTLPNTITDLTTFTTNPC